MLKFLLNKVASLNFCNFIKKRLQSIQHRCFSAKFHKLLIAPFLQNTSGDYFWKGSVKLNLTLLHGCFSLFKIVQVVPNRTKHHIFGINDKCFREMTIKKNNELARLLKRLPFLLLCMIFDIFSRVRLHKYILL